MLLLGCAASAGAQGSEEFLEKAEFLLQNDRYEDALLMFDQAGKTDGKNYMIPYKKSVCYIGMGKYQEAVGELEKSVSLNPKFFEAYERLADLYSQIFRNAPRAVHNFDKAFQHDEDVENKLRYKLEIINMLYSFNKHHLAIKHIKDAKEIIPDSFDLLFYEAQYYNEMDKYTEALEIMEKLIPEVPETSGNEVYFYELGRAYFGVKEYAKSLEAFKKADGGEYRLKVSQFSAEYFMSIAHVYYNVFEFDRSQDFLDITLALNPILSEGLELQKKLAGVRLEKAKLIEALRTAIESEKDENALLQKYRELAIYYNQSGQYIDAMDACVKYLSRRERDIEMTFLQAMSEMQIKKYDEASAMLSRMVKSPAISPAQRALLSFGLGLIYKNQGQLDLAEESFKNAYAGSFKNAAGHEMTAIFKLKQLQETMGSDAD